jgi:hypothetical protein
VLTKVENAVKVEPVGEFELKGDTATSGGVQRTCYQPAKIEAQTDDRCRRLALRVIGDLSAIWSLAGKKQTLIHTSAEWLGSV